jgi:hypothetical protein
MLRSAKYAPSLVIGEADRQDLVAGFAVGKRFKSSPVVRVAVLQTKERTVKFMLIMRATDEAKKAYEKADFEEIINAMGAYNESLMKAGVLLAGDGLTSRADSQRSCASATGTFGIKANGITASNCRMP